VALVMRQPLLTDGSADSQGGVGHAAGDDQ